MLNKKAIENAVLVIILAVALVGVGITVMTLRIPSGPTAYVVQPPILQPQACQLDCDDSDPNVNPDINENSQTGNCDDGKDNDCDGDIDCADNGCNNDPACEPICGNEIVEPGEFCDPPGSECNTGQQIGICDFECQCNHQLCQFCGDGECNHGENQQTCAKDCQQPVCGNKACEPGEAGNGPKACPEDCETSCGDASCDPPQENNNNCPEDCVCIEIGSFTVNPEACGSECGNGLCEYIRNVVDPGDEGRPNCRHDCCSAPCNYIAPAYLAPTDGDSDCDDDDPCTSEVCLASGFCDYTFDEACCDSDSDCDDGNSCTDDSCDIVVPEGFSPQQTGTCSNVPNDENSCTDGNSCTDDVCDDGECVGTGDCPQTGGGGGGGYVQQQQGCCVPCRDDPNELCEGRITIYDDQCHLTTNTRCNRNIVPPPAAPEGEASGGTGGSSPYFSQLPNSGRPPPELPRGTGTGSQQSFVGQSSQDSAASQRQRLPSAQGALTQESSASPAAWTLLLLIAVLAGVYAYFNWNQVSAFFKKEEKKAEPIVEEIKQEWKQITKPHKAHAKHKAKRHK